ncbi:MAG: hypothetical protein COB67_08155 [SAR324 cluster bacterium]|uniref:HEAT repeat domain-containing protein n=1 Tax=SAR324 cluster bacterium TaxID=2024889 RepID=A0A2A4T2H4_9DELT|nr:MAG: hypothetical protein COB67_08155 [SAR324 cluster bacterium]
MDTLATKRRERGEVTPADIDPFLSISTEELLYQLSSPKPSIRTCAATVLSSRKGTEIADCLCQQLKNEQKLYCKIAISNSLVNIGSLSVQPLLALLGKIGRNQETGIPQKGFNKISYPLPRDIAARILCRMGGGILPEVFAFLENERQPIELEQAIDVIGHIVYTSKLTIDSNILIQIADKYSEALMVQFKIIRCFSGFADDQTKHFLYKQLKSHDLGLQFEAARSVVLSGLDLPVDHCKWPEEVNAFIKQLTKKSSGRKKPHR